MVSVDDTKHETTAGHAEAALPTQEALGKLKSHWARSHESSRDRLHEMKSLKMTCTGATT